MRLINADALLEAVKEKRKFENIPQYLQDEYKDMPEVLLRNNLSAVEIINIITNAPTVQCEGWVSVPIEPSDEHLTSMAKRYDHGLCIDGYYDTKPIQFGASHAQRMEGTKIQMRQLYEEAIGEGFYKIPDAPDKE